MDEVEVTKEEYIVFRRKDWDEEWNMWDVGDGDPKHPLNDILSKEVLDVKITKVSVNDDWPQGLGGTQ